MEDMSRRLRARALVGRAEELALLDGLAADAGAGRGSVVVLHGEAGVGKSRLVAEVVARAGSAGRTVLSGRAVEGCSAYRPLADALLGLQRAGRLPPPAAVGAFAGALASLLPGWAATPDDAAVGDRSLLVSEGLVRLLRLLGRDQGVLLVLDDLHWADVDTLAVLDRLTDAGQEVPALLVLAARPESPELLQRLATRAHHSLALRRLSAGEADELAQECVDGTTLPEQVRAYVRERAEGLPFLVEEMLSALVDAGALVRTGGGWSAPAVVAAAVPASFAAVVHARLTALGPAVRAVVHTAAVMGRQVDWRLLPAVTGESEEAVLDALALAVDRGLLAHEPDAPDAVRFVHALTREAVLERLLPPQRAALARRAARVVEAEGRDLVLAATLCEVAGDRPRAARLLLAAEQRDGGALGSREQLLRRALRLCPQDDDVALALVQVLALAGKAAEARSTGDPLLSRLSAADPRRLQLALTLARACHVAAASEDAVGYLDLAGDGPAVTALAAHVAFVRQRPDDAERQARAVVQAADPAVRCEALELIGRVARLHGRRDDAETAFAAALAAAQQHRLALWEVRALHELGTLDMLGPARTERLEAARELALQVGLLATAAVLDLQIAGAHLLRMDLPATREVAGRGVELAESLRLPVLAGAGLVFVATTQGHAGLVEQMHATLDEAERRLQRDVDKLGAARLARGTPAMLAHDLPAWRAALHAGMEVLRRNPSASPSPARGQHALLETVLGDGSAEREELRSSGATVQACNEGALAYADAVAAARAGTDPAVHLERAEAVMRPLAWRRHHMRLLIAPAAVQDGWGSPVEWLREGLEHFSAAGDEGLARACRERLRAAGAPVPRRGRGDSVVPPHLRRLGVTSREMDVLGLVAEGLSNAGIAERLVLSPRTVESHVASVLSKTGASGRGDLRRLPR
jgi:DNA-binding CsgD family transcriptional regulator